jgi:hypothetical protein
VRCPVEHFFQKRILKAPSADRTRDRTLTKRMLCQLSCRGAWRERAHHSSENTPLRPTCCERHRHTMADRAPPCVAGPRLFPNSWRTIPKHARNNTDALHRTAGNRLRGGSSPRGQSPMERIQAPAGRARWIPSPSPQPLGCHQHTDTHSKHHTRPPSPRQLTTVVGDRRSPCEEPCLFAFAWRVHVSASAGVRTHAPLPAVDLRSIPLTIRADRPSDTEPSQIGAWIPRASTHERAQPGDLRLGCKTPACVFTATSASL